MQFWNQLGEKAQRDFFDKLKNYRRDETMKIGMLTSGGDCQGLNAALRGVAKAEIKFAIEIQGEKKKALEGVAIFLYYFN